MPPCITSHLEAPFTIVLLAIAGLTGVAMLFS